MESALEETIELLESKIFPQLARKWGDEMLSYVDEPSGSQLLPCKLPLKRRLAEYRFGALGRRQSCTVGSGKSEFTGNLWAIEKFKDITPAIVVAIFEESIVLEPGNVGPLPIGHPVAREIIFCINNQILTLALLEKLREFGTPMYDGCVVFGVVDYRSWAFSNFKSNSSAGSAAAGNDGRNDGAKHAPLMSTTPEMHKILLKPSFATFTEDVHKNLPYFPKEFSTWSMEKQEEFKLDFESRVLMGTSPTVCLDPSPLVFNLMSGMNFGARKMSLLSESITNPKQKPTLYFHNEDSILQELLRSSRLESFSKREHLPRSNNINGAVNGMMMQQQQKFKLLSLMDGIRDQKKRTSNEAMYGLDARKDPSKLGLANTPTFTWITPTQSLWRTIRFEERLEVNDNKAVKHYTIHVLITRNVFFEVVTRIGSSPCLGDLMPTTRNHFMSKGAVDAFIEQVKLIMSMEGKTCVADVSNPNALTSVMRTPDPSGGNVMRGVTRPPMGFHPHSWHPGSIGRMPVGFSPSNAGGFLNSGNMNVNVGNMNFGGIPPHLHQQLLQQHQNQQNQQLQPPRTKK